jgi:hypothetical protein
MSTLKVDTIQNVAGTVNKGVLQVVTARLNTVFSTTSTSFTDITGLDEVEITPRATSSKILVLYSYMPFGTTGGYGFYRLVRDSTAIFVGDASGSRTRSASSQYFYSGNYASYYGGLRWCEIVLDAPSSTSQLTYKAQVKTTGGSTVGVNTSGYNTDRADDPIAASSLTVMEIEG